jgi:rSAM/selenodomain-associated transferase 2
MPADLSIVIPTLNAEDELPACLQALMEGLTAGLIREVVLSDGGSSDATLAIADAAGANIVTGPASRGGQLRRGCAAATAPWLLVLHADTQLETGWVDAVINHMQGSADPGYFRLRFRAKGVMPAFIAGWANLRSQLLGLPYGDQGLLVSRILYDSVDGFADQPLMEDVAIMRALPRARTLPARASTSAGRYQAVGWLRRGSRNLWTLLRYYLGARPEKLVRSYTR